MSRQTDYTNAAQQRILKLVLALFGDVINGYLPVELIKRTGASASQMTRDLDNLRSAGLAEEEAGRWRLTARLPQQAVKVYAAIGRAETRLEEARSAINRNTDY